VGIRFLLFARSHVHGNKNVMKYTYDFFVNVLPLSGSWESKLAKYFIFDIMLIKRMGDAFSTWLLLQVDFFNLISVLMSPFIAFAI
jgi:hypothetical protein